jgi:hypothetical protein
MVVMMVDQMIITIMVDQGDVAIVVIIADREVADREVADREVADREVVDREVVTIVVVIADREVVVVMNRKDINLILPGFN